MSGTLRPTIAILANRGFAISNSRIPLIIRMRNAGWRILLITTDDSAARTVESLGVVLEAVNFYRGGLSIFRDIRALIHLIRLFAKYKPELVHCFHAKPILLASIAIALIPSWRPRVVSTITGLGYSYIEGGMSWLIASIGYRLLMKRSDATIFQNQDDLRMFVGRKWIDEEKATLISSSGVDTKRFRPGKNRSTKTMVLMLSRLIHQKGVQDYLDAARIVIDKYTNTTFLLAGEIETDHADRIAEMTIVQATRESGVKYLGFVSNVEELLSATQILVFPSYYREGLPRVVIEAAACAVPTIGADVPGTREAIDNGITGFLVPPRDHRLLAERIGQLLDDEELRVKMGSAARQKALKEFDVNLITEKQLDVYKTVLSFPCRDIRDA
jgi:glycosyltransferase involved in cell wall biosynthesis